MKPLNIVLEGPDYTGKSTLISKIDNYLKSKGQECVVTGHPGSTPVGQTLRGIIKDPSIKIDKHTRAILLAADNYEFQVQHALPSIGKWLLSDRSNFISSMAYQLADGIKLDDLIKVHDVVIDYRPIDICFVLDIDFETRRARQSKRGIEKDYFERDEEHFNKLRSAYKSLRSDSYIRKFMAQDGQVIDVNSMTDIDSVLVVLIKEIINHSGL